jgi:hypothetical protein
MRWIGLHVLVCMAFGATPDQARRRLQAFRPAASRRLNSHPDRLPGKYLLIDTVLRNFSFRVVQNSLKDTHPPPRGRCSALQLPFAFAILVASSANAADGSSGDISPIGARRQAWKGCKISLSSLHSGKWYLPKEAGLILAKAFDRCQRSVDFVQGMNRV